ncbi:MAG: hypothetical protein HY754_05920 [Nitrospirae bacterium]|nr:hypothetical protein [Nitrospirota bacterium]
MNPLIAVFIMMNNYFHDVAIATLLASGVTMWLMVKNLGDKRDEPAIKYFLAMHHRMTLLAKFSIYWIMVGGIPRILAYKRFEWANAVETNHVSCLIIKHIITFIFVCSGVYVWLRLGKRIKQIKGTKVQ